MYDHPPLIVDSDAGTDPDDTAVAMIVARHRTRFPVALLVTNDETTTFAKARFVAQIVDAVGCGALPVAAGLPSNKQRTTDNADEAGLVAERSVATDAIERIIDVLAAHERVIYIGLGALSNLAAALARRPDLAARVALYQMGPAVMNGFARGRAQYNARIDPGAFRRVLEQVPVPTLVMTHTTWGFPAMPPPLGVFPGDPIATAMAASGRADHALYLRHLAAFVASGKDCSILHDPATLLAPTMPELFDFVEVEIAIDDEGWLHLAPSAVDQLRAVGVERCVPVAAALAKWTACHASPTFRARISLLANVAALRAAIASLLLE